MFDLAVIGGGAAGFFAAINFKLKNRAAKVVIFEKSPTVLGKVKISGGGRCNVTHACFDNALLLQYYPRGSKELRSLFEQFGPSETIQWFGSRGIRLKTEPDGRMFPITDDAQTIIDCFLSECRNLSIDIRTSEGIKSIVKDNAFTFTTDKGVYSSKYVLLASGSSPYIWEMLRGMGHTIAEPVPSLFTFNIKDPLIIDLMGLSMRRAEVQLQADAALLKKHRLRKSDVVQSGPLLITHWGLSGPAVLKLSSVAARLLSDVQYRFKIKLNLSGKSEEETFAELSEFRMQYPRKQLGASPLFTIPSRLWQRITELVFQNRQLNWADAGKKDLLRLTEHLCAYEMEVKGKSTNKDEFVTAGGVELSEVHFKTMESKRIPGLYFAGEVLNIDALTGGFNFQAAWTEAWVFAENLRV